MMMAAVPQVDEQMFHQVHEVRGTRAFRPINIGNLVVVYWGQRFSAEKIRRFFTLTQQQPDFVISRGGELFGMNLFEQYQVSGRLGMQAINYVVDPRFAHFPWAQKKTLLGDSFAESYTATDLRQILCDLCMYVRPAVGSEAQADHMMHDITAQLEASLSLL
eukprot:TRINITY_DN14370_c0_g1_i1.p1 TRINITY_DN14370_c0_g1~~TRINITY_DN14370_c0_g1_i1.p1  ORF type:complete len:162 (-),score=25.92 TRINITY_DN14370_c0_g1_i1:18-503(-)